MEKKSRTREKKISAGGQRSGGRIKNDEKTYGGKNG